MGKLIGLFWLIRLNRTIMVATIAGTAAFVAGSEVTRSLWILLGSWFLAVGGFSLDFYADRDLDIRGPRSQIRHNPIAEGIFSPTFGLAFSIFFLALSFIVIFLTAPLSLIAWAMVLAVLIGLALHVFETPLSRAFTLGLLQSLYITMGGFSGSFTAAIALTAVMFFFAMFGGRGMIDIRDFPEDETTKVLTLPKRYGIKKTARFTGISLFVAYTLSFIVYLTGDLGPVYLYLDIAFIVIGLICAILFMVKPTPRLARILTPVFMMGEGVIICLALILGSAFSPPAK